MVIYFDKRCVRQSYNLAIHSLLQNLELDLTWTEEESSVDEQGTDQGKLEAGIPHKTR